MDDIVYHVWVFDDCLLVIFLLFDAVSQYLQRICHEFFLLCELHHRRDGHQGSATLYAEQPFNGSFVSEHGRQASNQYFQVLWGLDVV